MTDHPLTNKICEKLSCFDFQDCDEDGIMMDMRAAADWQLHKDARFFGQFLIDNCGVPPEKFDSLVEEFERVMRLYPCV